MRKILSILFALWASLCFAQENQKIEKPYKMRHFGVYAGYNCNNIQNGALERLTDLQNAKHNIGGRYYGYKDFLRMNGFSGGIMAWNGRLFADFGFNIRKNEQTARFKDHANEFQTMQISMNTFHFGFGINMSDPAHKVIISPGISLGMGKFIVKEINYRTELDLPIPATQLAPIGVRDDSKNISSFNANATAFVNVMLGNLKRGPKVIIQPFVTLPFVQNDLTRAVYANDVKVLDPALKGRMTYWGFKVAIAI